MPTLVATSALRDTADGQDIALTARHILHAGAPSRDARAVKGRWPAAGIDVILQSNLDITIAGRHNNTVIPPRVMQTSAIAQHLLNYFRVVRGLSWPALHSLRVLTDATRNGRTANSSA